MEATPSHAQPFTVTPEFMPQLARHATVECRRDMSLDLNKPAFADVPVVDDLHILWGLKNKWRTVGSRSLCAGDIGALHSGSDGLRTHR